MKKNVPLYVSSPDVTQEQLDQLQHTFDISQDYPEIDRMPDSEWAVGRTADEIWNRRRQQRAPGFGYKRIAILDERTARDLSVVLVSPELNEDDVFESKSVRFDPKRVPGAAMNLQISNQSLDDYEPIVHDDGVWRDYPAET